MDSQNHVMGTQTSEISREFNPAHRIFWIDTVFFGGLLAFAAWQVYEYASSKACAVNKPYLFTGAHHLWRILVTCILALILLAAEVIWPGDSLMHYVICLAMLADAALLYVHTEKFALSLSFPVFEAVFTCILAFGVSDKGRITTPMLLMVASFRLAGELWPLSQDEDAFKIVSATLMSTLAWHWFPLSEALDLFSEKHATTAQSAAERHQYDTAVDLIFLSNIGFGHLSVLVLLWRIFPHVFRNELAYELQMQERQAGAS